MGAQGRYAVLARVVVNVRIEPVLARNRRDAIDAALGSVNLFGILQMGGMPGVQYVEPDDTECPFSVLVDELDADGDYHDDGTSFELAADGWHCTDGVNDWTDPEEDEDE